MPITTSVYDILTSTISSNGTITYQCGDAVNGVVTSDNVEKWGIIGLASRPQEATPNGTDEPQALILEQSDRDIVVGERDTTSQDIFATLKPGETQLYAVGPNGTGQGRVKLSENGSVNLYTKFPNLPTGSGFGLFINPDDDSLTLMNSKGYGLLVNDDGFFIIYKDKAVKLTDSGIELVGKVKTQNLSALGGVTAGNITTTGTMTALHITGASVIAGAVSPVGGILPGPITLI